MRLNLEPVSLVASVSFHSLNKHSRVFRPVWQHRDNLKIVFFATVLEDVGRYNDSSKVISYGGVYN